jgi:Rho GTPase-activating protein RGD1
VLNPPQQTPSAPPQAQRQSDPPASFASRQGPPQSFGVTPSPLQSHASQPYNGQGPPPGMQQHERAFSQGQIPQQYNNGSMGPAGGPPMGPPPGHGAYNSVSISSSGPPQLQTLPFQVASTPPPQAYPQQQVPPSPYSPSGAGHLPPLKPVFGVSLEELFERDSSAVPMVVYQCIQAIDLFGLEVEGIYRLSGTASHITKLKAMFDNGKLDELSCPTCLRAKCSRRLTIGFPQSRELLSRCEQCCRPPEAVLP